MVCDNGTLRNLIRIKSDQDLVPFGNHSNHQHVYQDHVILKVDHVIIKVDHVIIKVDHVIIFRIS